MGYDVYLVKKGNWFDDVSAFSEAEWESLREEHRLAEVAYFSDGRISVKNPSREQLGQLVAIASQHGWSVQGDDGETYSSDGPVVRQSGRRGILDRLRDALARKEVRKSMAGVSAPFAVGERVRSIVGKTGGVVIEVDPDGNHGAGSIKVRFPDGSVEGAMFIAHGFEKE